MSIRQVDHAADAAMIQQASHKASQGLLHTTKNSNLLIKLHMSEKITVPKSKAKRVQTPTKMGELQPVEPPSLIRN